MARPRSHETSKELGDSRPFNYAFKPFLTYYFEYDSYPSYADREIMTQKSGMTPRQIEVWFQNQRRIAQMRANNENKIEEIMEVVKAANPDLTFKSVDAPRYPRSADSCDFFDQPASPHAFPAVFKCPPKSRQFRNCDERPHFPLPDWMCRSTIRETAEDKSPTEEQSIQTRREADVVYKQMCQKFTDWSLRDIFIMKDRSKPPAATFATYHVPSPAPHPALVRYSGQPSQSMASSSLSTPTNDLSAPRQVASRVGHPDSNFTTCRNLKSLSPVPFVTKISRKSLVPEPPNSPTRYIKPAHDWLLDNLHNPYPTVSLRETLSADVGWSRKSLDNWFIDARKYIGWNALRKKFKTRKALIEAATRYFKKSQEGKLLTGVHSVELEAMAYRAKTMFDDESEDDVQCEANTADVEVVASSEPEPSEAQSLTPTSESTPSSPSEAEPLANRLHSDDEAIEDTSPITPTPLGSSSDDAVSTLSSSPASEPQVVIISPASLSPEQTLSLLSTLKRRPSWQPEGESATKRPCLLPRSLSGDEDAQNYLPPILTSPTINPEKDPSPLSPSDSPVSDSISPILESPSSNQPAAPNLKRRLSQSLDSNDNTLSKRPRFGQTSLPLSQSAFLPPPPPPAPILIPSSALSRRAALLNLAACQRDYDLNDRYHRRLDTTKRLPKSNAIDLSSTQSVTGLGGCESTSDSVVKPIERDIVDSGPSMSASEQPVDDALVSDGQELELFDLLYP
ncbi:hypothetical protein K435DRAFT_260958 [Dendrothele bispora CBS 962.96]|uniref:Homeobox domain-containing protein n=1 Tax=Dendrothele bispora (strain CBS 962.96) TaxID=1314807 RepID=A0A4S8MXU3_DENBC|nr:hypothetical protein K435DRAFT_260958 [Dendrothele bispora CBS 962.96]